MVSKIGGTLLTLSIFFPPLVQGQFISSLPQCVQNCISQPQDGNCEVTDVTCLCRASADNFLPELITCIHNQCDNNLDNNLLLMPLQLACDIAGAPIPESAIQNAENQASSLAIQVTTTQTVTIDGASASGGSKATTAVQSLSVFVTTTTVTTTQGGTTLAIVYPVTIEKTITESGSGSTVTSVSIASPSSGFTGVIPVIIVTTDSDGSTYTRTTTEPGAISTYTTTDSNESTVTRKSTYTTTATAVGHVVTTTNSAGRTFTTTQSPSASSGSSSDSSTTTETTSIAADKTSSSGTASSKTSSAANEDETNSSPFTDTNNSATRRRVENWLGLSVLLAVGIVWV